LRLLPVFEADWRPATYWPPLPSDEDLIGRIRGARRREAVRHALATGDVPRRGDRGRAPVPGLRDRNTISVRA